MARILVLLTLLWLAACATPSTQPPARPAPLILISLDGFHPSYLDRGLTPTLSRLAREGVVAGMTPSFPTKTFPNHYTLVTGLRPDQHGIVDNNMEDPAIPGVTFRMSNPQAVQDPRWWAEGEPIWAAAERAGLKTATLFWPGSEAPHRGRWPTYWLKYQHEMPLEARVDTLLSWLDLPAGERPAFLTLYAHQVDSAGHDFGPQSPQVNEAVAQADAMVGRLIEGLKRRGLEANLVIVSDHGMAPVPGDHRVYLDDHAPRSSFRVLSGGAFATIYPLPGREAEVERGLLRRIPHVQCWRKDEVPSRFGYGRHRRVAPIVCLPDVGWMATTRDFRPSKPEPGNHGFDPFAPEMRAVFIAHGPAFRAGARLPTFGNVEVHGVLMRALGLSGETPTPSPTASKALIAP